MTDDIKALRDRLRAPMWQVEAVDIRECATLAADALERLGRERDEAKAEVAVLTRYRESLSEVIAERDALRAQLAAAEGVCAVQLALSENKIKQIKQITQLDLTKPIPTVAGSANSAPQYIPAGSEQYRIVVEERDALRAQLAAAEQDARRYRYLRTPLDVTRAPEPLEVLRWYDTGPDHISGDALDAAVDAGIEAAIAVYAAQPPSSDKEGGKP